MYPIQIKSHHFSTKITLRINHNQKKVIITKPIYISEKKAEKFYQKHLGWVEQNIQKISTENRDLKTIQIFDKTYQIITKEGKGHTQLEDDNLIIFCNKNALAIKLKTYLKTILRPKIHELVQEKSSIVGLKWHQIRLKEVSTRWGSCSAKGNLNFSWRLIFLPHFVFEYIICHEVAHLRHQNHQAEFWALVDILCPHTQRAKKWLKANGHKAFEVPL